MSVTIYHNPRCSKSRQTLQLLVDQGIDAEIIEYLKTPPSAADIKKILSMLNMQARDLMRKKEPEFRENHLDDDQLSEADLVDAISKHPKLMERPIVVNNGKAAIGRPPENVLGILS
ncbi:MAG: arsenate reductase (glutaredoxin) [Gammaproteobacteria bacterium]